MVELSAAEYPRRMLTPDQTVALAERVLNARHPRAACGFATGSLVRGDGTEGSDLDLVVLYDALPNARREALVFEGTPVETFIHDPETLAWTFRDEVQVGRCAFRTMVAQGRLVGPQPAIGRPLKRRALNSLAKGPGELDATRRDLLRYHVTDRLGDLRDPRPTEEFAALGVQLYDPIAELILRGAGRWAGNGKWIPRTLRAYDPALAERFIAAFEQLYVAKDPAPLIALAEDVLAPHGGLLFEGYESAWPRTNRIARRRRNKA